MTSSSTAHDPITPDECAEQIRNSGACQHGPAYPTEAPIFVGIQSSTHNLQLFRVTQLADGMERVEYAGHVYTELNHPDAPNTDPEAKRLVLAARTMARVTGSVAATHTEEGPGGAVRASGAYYRGHGRRMILGDHVARTELDPAQQALAAEHAAQRGTSPATGDRWIVATLTGYKLIQDRPLEHRDCSCFNGRTSYAAGTVEQVIAWMDNSTEAIVKLDSGTTETVQLVAPHGDVCF